MFWVGLGVLVVGTHTTLSVSEDTPVDLAEEAPAGRIEEAEGIVKAEAARLPGTQRPGMHTPQPRSFPGRPCSAISGSRRVSGTSRLSHPPWSCLAGRVGPGTATCLCGTAGWRAQSPPLGALTGKQVCACCQVCLLWFGDEGSSQVLLGQGQQRPMALFDGPRLAAGPPARGEGWPARPSIAVGRLRRPPAVWLHGLPVAVLAGVRGGF